MRQVWIKKADKAAEAETACDWLLHTAGNCYDPKVLLYPKTELLKAVAGDKTIMYVPVQTVFMPDALGFNPDASVAEKALAMQSLFQVLAFESAAQGHGEVYFLCREATTVAYSERHEMERVDIPLFRLKVK